MILGGQQTTLNEAISIDGVGLHTGEPCTLIMRPAAENTGISFKRSDVRSAQPIAATADNVVFTQYGTVLANGDGTRIATTEHLMAALAILQIDNVEIIVDGPEVPVLDGSAEPFVEAILAKGRAVQNTPRRVIRLHEPINVSDGDRSISIVPADAFSLSISIDFGGEVIGQQSLSINGTDHAELTKLARARTFCRRLELDALRALGLGKGGSLENAIVVDGDTMLNDAPLRDEDEFVRHKALDLLGDFYLLGAPIAAAITAIKPGHTLNTRAVSAIAEGAHHGGRTASA